MIEIPVEMWAEIQKLIQGVAENGFGKIEIGIQEGQVVSIKPEYSYKYPLNHLTDFTKVSIIQVIE